MVGSIRFDVETGYENTKVKKFDPHGYFGFGGSTVLTLFKAGTIEFDDDLLKNAKSRLETLVKVGERIGKATGYKG